MELALFLWEGAFHYGKNMMESVSDEELLSAFIPGDTAHTLIKEYSSLYNVLHIVSERQLKTMKGIGNANLNRMCCLREILDRVNRERQRFPNSWEPRLLLLPISAFKRQDAGRIMGSIP